MLDGSMNFSQKIVKLTFEGGVAVSTPQTSGLAKIGKMHSAGGTSFIGNLAGFSNQALVQHAGQKLSQGEGDPLKGGMKSPLLRTFPTQMQFRPFIIDDLSQVNRGFSFSAILTQHKN